MAETRPNRIAFGKPGIDPKWTHGNKDGVGTAYSGDSRIWFTLFQGVVTEVFYPTADRPQIRDLQYLVTDGKTFFHEEKRPPRAPYPTVVRTRLCFQLTNSSEDVGTGSSKK